MAILIVEDEEALVESLSSGLAEANFDTVEVGTASAAIDALESRAFELMILDIGLPDRDGFAVLDHLATLGIALPVIILTAHDDVDQRVRALDNGADDYLGKPFAFSELLARIRALLRRVRPDVAGTTLRVGDLRMDLVKREVTRGRRKIVLTPREFDMLAYLAQYGGQVVSRDMLVRNVLKMKSSVKTLDNIIDVHVSHIRDKIDRDFPVRLLRTVRGVGLMLKAD